MAEPNSIFTKKQVAEFNTSADTLRQIAQMEWNINEMFRVIYSGGIDPTDNTPIKIVYHYIVYVYADVLWGFAWSILQKNKDEKEATFDKFEKELEILYNDWTKNHKDQVPTTLLERLRAYKKWLFEVKQKKLKLGIPTRTETDANERMEKAAGV